jgi:hypothetical protein
VSVHSASPATPAQGGTFPSQPTFEVVADGVARQRARHGTKYGYQLGCREECCRRANTKSLKMWRAGMTGHLIDATGTKRRIQSLVALGWTMQEIGQHAGGYSKNWAHVILSQQTVVTDTARKVDAVFERLSMTVPIGPYRNRTRLRAARNGWVPPLAWDDIDDPNEQPSNPTDDRRYVYDEVVIQRVIDGHGKPRTLSTLEAAEVVRRLRAAGVTEYAMKNHYGLKPERYGKKGAAA